MGDEQAVENVEEARVGASDPVDRSGVERGTSVHGTSVQEASVQEASVHGTSVQRDRPVQPELPAQPLAAGQPAEADPLVAVNRAADSLRDVDGAPLAGHAERYKAVHAVLQGALSDTDLRDSG